MYCPGREGLSQNRRRNIELDTKEQHRRKNVMGERINQSKSEKRPGENLARAEERHEKQIDSFVSHLAKPVWMAASVSGLKL